jgi:sugar phosphate isomerase/epimerase
MISTRRSFVLSAAAAPVLRGGGRPVRLGGPIFVKSDDPRELAREHRRLGYSAAYCPPVESGDEPRLKAIREAYAAENVAIAEVGAWVNLTDPDEAKRQKNFQYVVDRLSIAEAVGARCCVDIAGSKNPKVWYGPHPDNLSPAFFDEVVEITRRIIDSVKPKRTTYSIEMMGWIIPDSPDSYLRLMKAIDRPAFAVHMDVCNIINSPARFYNNTAVIEECFRKLGHKIVSCHAKDLEWIPEMNIHFVEVIPGRGSIDYGAYLRNLAKMPVDAPLMLEHLKAAEEYDEGKRYIQKVAAANGVTFA